MEEENLQDEAGNLTELVRLRRVRGAHRGFITKTIPAVRDSLRDYEQDKKKDLLKFKELLTRKVGIIQKLDEEILGIVSEKYGDAECTKEVEEAEMVTLEANEILLEIDEKLEERTSSVQTPMENLSISSSNTKKAKAKLPKIELQTFYGKPTDWPEFWDAFSSTVDADEELPDAVKFQYLRKSLEEPAKSVISGFKITAANYKAAVKLLQERYARPAVIKRAHINELLNMNSIFDDRQVGKLRSFHDKAETHFRGLESLSVDTETYSAIVVPVLLEKIPQSVRLNMVRSSEKNQLDWDLRDFLDTLMKELEIRETHAPLIKAPKTPTERRSNFRRTPERQTEGTATALTVARDQEKRCAFCLENHEEEDCKKVTDLNARKTLIKRYGRCYSCIKKGHKATNCRMKIVCRHCHGKHHSSLCCKMIKSASVEGSGSGDPIPSSQPETPSGCANIASCVNNVGQGSSAALQLARGVVNGDAEKSVRVLFDSGSQKSFVTVRVVEKCGLRVVRSEKLGIRTFGSEEADVKEREVVQFDLMNVDGGERVKIEAYVVNKISDVSNFHVELVKKDFPHLRHIYFSDVSKEDILQVDVLIGSNFLWEFQGMETIRGEKTHPVAVNTKLGWVLSGPLKGKSLLENNVETVNVSFIESFEPNSKHKHFDKMVEKIWDLDSIGVRETNDVYTDAIDNISFNGQRYSVALPWKVGHKQLPSNFSNSYNRLKGQIRKLQGTPKLLEECDRIIREQEESGIIEKVTEMESAEKVYYMPSQIVVRENAETTKVRMVFDASSKEGKKGTSLNECLHIGPPMTPLLFDVLIRFRENNVPLVGDIQQAFLNVEIDSNDRNCLRFLWVEDVNAKNGLSIVVYRFNRVVFGVNSSPFLLNAVIRNHLEKYREMDPDFVVKMINSFYVDDLCTGAKTIDEAKDLFEKSRIRMKEARFNLRKWKTSDCELKSYIKSYEVNKDESDISYAKETLNANTNDESKTKVLGMVWNENIDTLEIELSKAVSDSPDSLVTKRSILSSLAKLFDPLGLVSPVSMQAKSLFQELCVTGIEWDEELPSEIKRSLVQVALFCIAF